MLKIFADPKNIVEKKSNHISLPATESAFNKSGEVVQ